MNLIAGRREPLSFRSLAATRPSSVWAIRLSAQRPSRFRIAHPGDAATVAACASIDAENRLVPFRRP